MTNPDNVGGLPELPELPRRCYEWHGDELWTAGAVRRYARAYGELCRAAPAGGDYRGVIPQVLDETINGVVSDLEMIAAGKDQVTGDPVSGLQSQRIAKAAHDRLLSAWNACDSAPAGSGEVEPLPVFSGNWIYVDTGQRFSGADLDGAAFAVYEPLLRKLQQGAE